MTNKKQDFPLHDYYKDIYKTYDLVNRVFTFGQDKNWRKKAVKACLENNPARILDICSGTGDLIIEIAKECKGDVEFNGYDFSEEMLQIAKRKAEKAEKKILFTEGDVATMPYENETFDTAGITFGIRNLIYENTNAKQHLSEISRVLRKNGRLVILESSKPENGIWRFFNSIYLQLILPYLGGIISGNLKAYKYLAKSSKNYYTKTEMSKILEDGGFKLIRSQSLFLGSVMLMVVEKQDNSSEK